MTLVKLICSTQQPRELDGIEQAIGFDETVDVDPALAGRPPTGEPGQDGYDPGEGLLAQHQVWAPGDSAGISPPVTEPVTGAPTVEESA